MADRFKFSDWGRKPWATPVEYYAGSRYFQNRGAAIRHAEMLSNRNQTETPVYWAWQKGGKMSELGHTTRYTGRKNPTKAQKREKSRKASVQRRVAVALAKFLKQANPAMKTTGATVTRLKGGGFTIRPIKATKGRKW